MEMELTPQQKFAVETQSPNVLVVAGAGSGKTRVLTAHIGHLLEHGADPSSILTFTFTRKAANEMKTLVAELVGERTTNSMLIGTFHSIALIILERHAKLLGYRPGITVFTDADQWTVLESVGRDLGYMNGRKWTAFAKKDVKYALEISNAHKWCAGIAATFPPDYIAEALAASSSMKLTVADALGKLIHGYRNRLFENNAVDFGMILSECQRLFAEREDILRSYQNTFAHVMVDEYQDTDLTQYNLHNWLSPPAHLFAVGDIDQCVYSWRSAHPELMLNLKDARPDLEVIKLEDCFRCGPSIVAAANTLIEHNKDRISRTLKSCVDFQSQVSAEPGRSEDVANMVKVAQKDGGFDWGDIAVLGRSHRTLKRLETVFKEQDVPCVRIGALSDVCETDAFRDLHAVMRLVANEWDAVAFLRLRPFLGANDPVAYAQVKASAASSCKSHWRAWLEQQKDVGSLVGTIHNFRPTDASVNMLAINVVDALSASLADIRSEDGEYLETLTHAWRFWQVMTPRMMLHEALRWFVTKDIQDEIEATKDPHKVSLMTVHAAKGLEWPCVIVVGLNEKSFPSSRGNEEEERRLCYVAITRAKERLVLHYRRDCDQAEGQKPQPPSRFFVESCINV